MNKTRGISCAATKMGSYLALVFIFSGITLAEPGRIVPTPHYNEPVKASLAIAHGGLVAIVQGPAYVPVSEKLRLAGDFVRRDLAQTDASLQLKVETGNGTRAEGVQICLWDYSVDRNPPVELSFLDREVLTDPDHYGQSYVIRTPDKESMWVVGSTDEGVLLGAMSILQLIQKTSDGVEILGAYIRDYPDFQYRAAACWLLNAESSRWALDRGQGIEGYKRLCERKLDEALRYKINAVYFDGFGWGLGVRFAGYAGLMRSLNRYARARGIYLVFGGYGASYGITYQTGPLYEQGAYLGQVFKNRASYPDGPTYECMGFPGAKKGVNPRIQGSCRANDELNKLKGEELREFVEAVEPGVIFIHHEDFGDYQEAEDGWQQRCARCRARWPNDSLKAPDGGAGGLAHGYSALIQAVNSVKNPADGYDASRDCRILLVSPVYEANPLISDDWDKVLELWKNIGIKLPRDDNVLVGFRESFPQKYGEKTWVETFNSVMKHAGLDLGLWFFFAGGADNTYLTDYPLTGAPAMDAEFLGAAGMYNFCGDFYQEPMEIINAEYSWNTRSTGFFRAPRTLEDSLAVWRRYTFEKGQPPEVFGAGGIYEVACNLLYGPKAGPIMAAYYQESAWVPDTRPERAVEDKQCEHAEGYSCYLPMTWDHVYAVPRHFRNLVLDSNTWSSEITNERFVRHMNRLKLTPEEVHHRLARRWSIIGEVSARGAKDVEKALRADPRPSCIEDLQFLMTNFHVDQPLIEALIDFHRGMERRLASPPDAAGAAQDFQNALREAEQAKGLAAQAYPQPIDPTGGGEVGAIRTYSSRLADAIKPLQQNSR
jgi:hypothetical protein